MIPSPDNVLEAAVASRSTFILSVPVFLEVRIAVILVAKLDQISNVDETDVELERRGHVETQVIQWYCMCT